MTTQEQPPDLEAKLEEAETSRLAAEDEAKRLAEENVEYKLREIGLDPKVGTGRSIVKDIARGEYDGDVTEDGLRAWAKTEYSEELVVEPPEKKAPESEQEKELEAQQQAQEQIHNVASDPPPPATPPDVIRERDRAIMDAETPPEEVHGLVVANLGDKAARLQDDFRAGRITTAPQPEQ